MTEFETSGSVTIEIDQGSLREARQEIEDEIGSVTVQARRESSGAVGRPRTDGGVSSMGLAGGGGLLEELNNQTELLDDIHEELQKSGVSGGEGGGGGGSGGMFGTARDMLAGRALSGGAAGGLGGLASRLVPSTAAGGAFAGLGLGMAGVNVMDRLGAHDAAEGLGSQARQGLPFGEQLGDASNFLPGVSVAAALPGLSRGNFDRAGEDFSEIWERRGETIGDIYPGDVGNERQATRYGGIPARDYGGGQVHTSPAGGRTPYTQRRNRDAADRMAEAREERERRVNQQQAESSPAQNLSRRQREAREEQQRRESLQQEAESSPAPNMSRRQREARERQQQRESSGSSPSSPGEQQQTAQVTNDITIEMSTMQETQREIERMIEEALREFGNEFSTGAGPGVFRP